MEAGRQGAMQCNIFPMSAIVISCCPNLEVDAANKESIETRRKNNRLVLVSFTKSTPVMLTSP